MKLLFHSDDYGLSKGQVDAILDCASSGCLNSVSVLANSPDLPGFLARLINEHPAASVTVHLNFVEGHCSADPSAIPLLVDERGFFKLSYGRMLLHSLLPARAALRKQLCTEIEAQILAVRPLLSESRRLRLDTHQHFHAIPLVFSSILDVVSERGLDVEYLRMPTESLRPFLRHPKALIRIPPVNYVKWALIWFLSLFNWGKLKESGIPTAAFCGILLSGNMAFEPVSLVLCDFVQLAKKRGTDLEVLFHPGRLRSVSECPDERKTEFVRFNLSAHRDVEFFSLHALKPLAESLSNDE